MENPVDFKEILRPGSPTHAKLLKMVVDRLEYSERKMSDFYPRWRVNERKFQAYIDLPDYEALLAAQNNKGKPAKVVSIQVPYSFAVVQTIVTYLLHTFCGRQPIFQVGSYGDQSTAARNMEIMLQHNAETTKLVLQLYEMLTSAQVYQCGIVRVGWVDEYKYRTRMAPTPKFDLAGMQTGVNQVPQRVQTLVYSGNDVSHIDPFLFFPDPTVPMTRVNKDGDFVFWRAYKSHTFLQEQEAAGIFHNVAMITSNLPANRFSGSESDRSLRAQGDGIAGTDREESTIKIRQIDEGTVKLVPKEWGLGSSNVPEKWLITVVNKNNIVRAEPLEANHDLHPVAVLEPNAFGAQFGSISTVDITGPVQDHIAWLINSHMQNVRGVINNRLVVNPHYVHMEDLKKDPSSGEEGSWLLRMKQSAFGIKPDQAIYQLQVADVTQGHIKNVEMMIRIGHMFAGVNENLMGLQDSKGRKTATEVRTSGEAGASRLAAQARIASSQGIMDIARMMGSNIQQRVQEEFLLKVLGKKAAEGDIRSADFYYPINDGTLPLDRAALLQVWQQILMGIAQDPELRANYSLPKIFAFVADLGGARNIDSFKVDVKPDAAIEQGMADGSLMPLPGMQPG